MTAETLKEIAKWGLGGIFGGVILAFFLADVRADQAATRTEHTMMREDIAAMKNITGQSDMSQQLILYVLTTMCVNAAKSDFQRSECVKKGGFR